ncbi:MAG: nucleotide disphospho-sugar-binding domain-containing protein [Candidatus Dormiibacterota bacterium]
MAKYLLVSSPIGGHVAPVRAVGAALARQGHRVRALTGSRFRSQIEDAGMTFLPMPEQADYDDTDLNGSFPGSAGLRGSEAVRFDLSNVFVKPMAHQYRAIVSALDQEPVDGIVAELTATGLLPLLLKGAGRPPITVLGCTPMPVTSRDTFPYGPGMAPPTSALARIQARFMTQVAKRAVLGKVQREVNRVLADLGLSLTPVFFLEWFTLAERFWQLTAPGFEYPRSDLAPNIVFAGQILPESPEHLPSWWADLDGASRVVHVTQGTIDNHDLSMLIGPTITGLADRDLLVVATTGGRPVADIPVALPANVRVAEFIPYHLLLPKVDVMVTNGGYGGVQFAIAHGVPLVVAGEREDKPEIAARVAWSGIGQNLKTGRPTSVRLAAAVSELLSQSAYRESSKKLAAQASGYDALAAITEWVESAPSRPSSAESL